MSSFVERLRVAIQCGFPTTLDAALAMRSAGVEGASYPNLRRVLAGDAEKGPTTTFVAGAAAVLGVTPEWLAFGHGHMTTPCGDHRTPLSPQQKTALERAHAAITDVLHGENP